MPWISRCLWFENRVCLFLVDDIWPAKNGKTSFFDRTLRQLLRESPESRMAISTRSTTIAQCAGSVVKFGARDALGLVSEKMFMAHATRGTSVQMSACRNAEIRSSVQKILYICGGLPIALAVTGSAVSFLTITHGDFETACDAYARRWRGKEATLAMRTQWEARA